MLAVVALLASAAPAHAEVPQQCADMEQMLMDHAVRADQADIALRVAEDTARGEEWLHDALENLWSDHESLMAEREELLRQTVDGGMTPEIELALVEIGEIEQDILDQIAWHEQRVDGLIWDIRRAERRSDRAHDALARVEDQLSRCIADAPPGPSIN
jgi:hypothetical protein